MNNPLRFADETFYQSGFHRQDGTGIESTTLSVVANSGWMMPYVGCMLVGIGMLVHFLTLLVQFLNKGDAPDISPADAERAEQLAAKLGIPIAKPKETARPATQKPAWGATSFMAITMLIGAGYLISVLIPPKAQTFQFDLYRFGQIPVVSEGRTKPIDSAASTALLAISGRSTLKIEAEEADKSSDQDPSNEKTKASKKSEILPATAWFLETVTDKRESDDRHVFRIENLEVQETVGVKKREGMRYSRNEIVNRGDEFRKQFEDARKQVESGAKPSVFQKKVLELSDKFATYGNLKVAFGLQNTIGGDTREAVMKSFERAIQVSEGLEERGAPIFAISPTADDEKWHTFSRAWILDLINRIQKKGEENKTVAAWDQILKAYSQNKPEEFNKAVDHLLSLTEANPPKDVKPWVIRLEAYMNYVQPFTKAAVLYMFAFVLGAIGWLAWPRGFNKAAFGLMLVVFVLHTAALVARLIISGRPPVTNLYSSAVFIGWGCVLLGLMFEVVYRIGIGNLVAAVAGFATLLIADGLQDDGDTFTVLQAVLDTQFWLATHVTCITLGYATTYLAGLFGVAYIVRGVCTPSLTREDGQNIYRMIYGTLCFSIFFSFVGTVLGGLWADDSWGRFWGWDPKENAALIIVLWNALALHARWGGMVRERGLASLAVAGNIFVSWSWWGVNALGAGLHSYGFKQGTLRILGEFILANLLIIAIASIPKKYWWSVRRQLVRPTGN